MTSPLLTPTEAAQYLRCSIKTLGEHVRSGALKYKALESIKAGDREVLCDFDRMPSLDETDELVLITAGYELADRLYAKSTRR